MSKDEKIYLVGIIYFISAFAHASGLFSLFWGLMFVFAAYKFISAQHSMHSDAGRAQSQRGESQDAPRR